MAKFNHAKWLLSKPKKEDSYAVKSAFWEKELERWETGYGGLNGRHYAYLTQGSLKTVRGSVITPRWRDVDQYIFEEDENSRKNQEDFMIVKRREVGLSSIFGGFMPIYDCIINSGTTQLLTSADKTRVKNLFSEKVIVMYQNLDENIKPKRLHERVDGFLHLGEKDKNGDIKGLNSKIICVETADSDRSAKSLETYRAQSIFLDELFLHPRADVVHASCQATIGEGFMKAGHIVFGGSCGVDNIKDESSLKIGSKLGEKLWADSKALRIRTFFIPGWMGIEKAPEYDKNGVLTGKILDLCPNGVSDEKRATEWILRRRDQLEKAEDKSHYYSFVKQYPLTIDEVFEVNRAGGFPKEIYDGLSRAKKTITDEGSKVGMFSIHVKENKIVTTPDKTGKYHIFSHAQPNKEYIAGCDPIPFGDANIEDGSDHTVVIKERYSDTYVAYYAERSMNSDIVVLNTIALLEAYKSNRFPYGAIMNPEANRAEVLVEKFKQYGKLHLLSNRPTHLGIEYNDKKAKKGWFKNDKTDGRANNYMIEFLMMNADRIPFMRLIEELSRYPQGNNDLVDAMKSCEVLDRELTNVDKIFQVGDKPKRKVPIITRDGNGRTITKWIEL